MADHLQGVNPYFLQLSFSLISNMFISPPAVSEINKYTVPLIGQIQAYRDLLLHRMGRGLISGSLQITFFLSGFYVLIKRYAKQSKANQYRLILILIATFVLTLGIIIFLPIPWQRYAIPLLPLIAFWSGYGLWPLYEDLQTAIMIRNTHSDRPI